MGSIQVVQEYIQSTTHNIERASRIFSNLSEKQINWKAGPASWSIGECISHLVNSNALYLSKIENIINSVSVSSEKDFPFKQSIVGKMISKGVDPANMKKTKTFKVFFPDASNISQNIIDNYVSSSQKFIELVGKMRYVDLKKIKLSSPVNKLLRMNLGDVLIIIQKHDERHLNQAERVMIYKDFPKG